MQEKFSENEDLHICVVLEGQSYEGLDDMSVIPIQQSISVVGCSDEMVSCVFQQNRGAQEQEMVLYSNWKESTTTITTTTANTTVTTNITTEAI